VYGQAGGAHTALDADVLATKSGTLSRPVLFHYTAQRAQLESIARNLFAALRNGMLRPRIAHRYPLAAAEQAHRDLEARRTTGQLLLLP
jgi:NADPH2:quinone reductase